MNDKIARTKKAAAALDELLGTELTNIIKEAITPPGEENSFWIQIPAGEDIDLSHAELSTLVAKTSNNYTKAARFCGQAKAECNRAEGLYKLKYKKSLNNNERSADKREAYAMNLAEDEFLAYSTLQSIVELAQSMENAARVASESARKLLDKSHASYMGESRTNAVRTEW